jgi:hypothetical protein
VRNHVKLLHCNHRLKDSQRETMEGPGSTQCAKATGREDVRVCNTRHKGEGQDPSTHAQASTQEEETTAMMSSYDTEIDWRKSTDGHLMAKRLKDIEQEESDYRKTGMRAARKHEEWRTELERAMTDAPSASKREPVYQASAYDTGSSPLKYEDFTSQAKWNFRRDKRPVFRNQGPLAFSATAVPDTPHVIVPKPVDPEKLDGLAYTRASPTFIRARINDVSRRPTVGLLDNCAAISLIDRSLLGRMEPPPELYNGEVNIRGIGSSKSSEFCVMPIFIDVTERADGERRKRKVRILVEFHVMDNLNESFVLGMDIIGPYQIDIITSRAEAKIQTAGGATFSISFGPGVTKNSVQESYHVVAAETITIPGQTETTVPALIAGHSSKQSESQYDLFLDPVPIWDDGLDMLGMVGKGLYSCNASKVWFANLGSHPITIRKGTRIASASHVSSMDTVSVLPIKHTAGGPGTAEIFSCVPKKVTDPQTLGKMRPKDEPHWSEYVHQYAFPATLMEPTDRPPPEDASNVDNETFDVSSDFGEDSRRTVLKMLYNNIEAFTLDGRPGMVHDIVLELDTDDDKLFPEKLRQTSPRKQVIIDDTLDQLLDWDVISPSDSRVSYPVVIVHQNGKDRFCVDYRSLNKHTRPMVYPMQRSDEMFEALAGKRL